MSEQRNYNLALVAECVLDKKMLVKATSLEDGKLKAKEYLADYHDDFSMFEVHDAVKNRKVASMDIKFIDCEDRLYLEIPETAKIIKTDLEVPYE